MWSDGVLRGFLYRSGKVLPVDDQDGVYHFGQREGGFLFYGVQKHVFLQGLSSGRGMSGVVMIGCG